MRAKLPQQVTTLPMPVLVEQTRRKNSLTEYGGITRKGAVRAREGDLGIIPGNSRYR